MVTQYPDRLTFTPATGNATYVNGDWLQPGAAANVEHPCRAEVNDAASREVKSADGQDMVYGWQVFAPLTCPDILAGTEVTLFNRLEQQVGKGPVKRFIRQQLNVRLWL